MKRAVELFLAIVICQGAGFLGAIFTTPAIPSWYASLQKPSFSPPNWLFAPVWFVLYTLMGIAAYLIWTQGLSKRRIKVALSLFTVQLGLNALWSILFFSVRSPLLALLDIILLWVLILLTIYHFLKISKLAGLLLLPYLLWVSFAAVLNLSIVRLN